MRNDISPQYLREMEKMQDSRLNISKRLNSEIDPEAIEDLVLCYYDLTCHIVTLLLDMENFEEGLALCRTLPWETYSRQKYVGISRALIQTGRHDEAKKLIDKGLRRYPKSEALWFNLGTLYHIKKDYVRSLKCYEKGLEIVPFDELMINGKANALHALGHYEEAGELYHELSIKYPESPGYAISHAWCYIDMGYPDEAFPVLNKIREEYIMADAYHGLYCAYRDMGLSNDAFDVIHEGIEQCPYEKSNLYIDIGHAYCQRGWIARAKYILKKGLKIFPEDEGILDLLRQIDDYPDDSDGDATPSNFDPAPGWKQETSMFCYG